MDQKNTADLVPVLDMAILSTLAPGIIPLLLTSHHLKEAFSICNTNVQFSRILSAY